MTSTTRRSHRTAVHALAVTALVLGACSVAQDDADTATDDAVSQAEMEAERRSELEEHDVADDAGEAPQEAADAMPSDAPDDRGPIGDPHDRLVIRNAELVLEVTDSAAAADEVARIAADAGGFVAETDLSRDDEGVVSGRMSLRVPSEQLDETVEELDALGDAVPVRRIDEQDVTAEVTDLEARRANLVAYERELADLLSEVRADGGDADELLAVFDRLTQVRGDIERVEGRLTGLEDRIEYSRIDVELRPTTRAAPVGDPGWSPADTLRDAVRDLSRALTAVADVAIRVGVTWLPIAAIVAVPVAGVILAVRAAGRRRRRDTEVSPSPDSVDTATDS